MLSAYAQSLPCLFPENIRNVVDLVALTANLVHVRAGVFFLCLLVTYLATAQAARAGRGGAGRLPRLRGGELTGRRPVHCGERMREC